MASLSHTPTWYSYEILSTCSLLTFPWWIAATKTLDLCSPEMTPLAAFFLLNENSDTIHQRVSPRLLYSLVVSLNLPSSMSAFHFLTTRRIKGNPFLAFRPSQVVGFCCFATHMEQRSFVRGALPMSFFVIELSWGMRPSENSGDFRRIESNENDCVWIVRSGSELYGICLNRDVWFQSHSIR